MPRNHLKNFPTAMLRRGMVHFHPGAWPAGRGSSDGAVVAVPAAPPARAIPDRSDAGVAVAPAGTGRADLARAAGAYDPDPPAPRGSQTP